MKRSAYVPGGFFLTGRGGAGAFVSVVQKEPGPLIPFSGKYEHYKSKKLTVKKGVVPFIRSDEVEGYFYEKDGISGYFSYDRIPGILKQESFQIGAPVFDKRRPDAIMFGSVQIPSPEAMIDVEREQAESYTRGEELHLNHPDGFYFIVFKGMVLGPVKITNTRAVNKLPGPLRR